MPYFFIYNIYAILAMKNSVCGGEPNCIKAMENSVCSDEPSCIKVAAF